MHKVLRSGATAFEYEREVQPRPKLGRWMSDLEDLLLANVSKPAREQLTLIRIFEELRERGYAGAYDTVRRYARRWSKKRGRRAETAGAASARLAISGLVARFRLTMRCMRSLSRRFVATLAEVQSEAVRGDSQRLCAGNLEV